MSKKIISLYITVIILLVVGIITTLIIMFSNNKKEVVKENKLYGTISEKGKNYVKIDPIDDGMSPVIFKIDPTSYNDGDFVLITYKNTENDNIDPISIEVVAKNDEIIVLDKETTTISTPVEMETTMKVYKDTTTTNKPTTTKEVKTTVAPTTTTAKATTLVIKQNADEVILEYVENGYDTLSLTEGNKQSLKQYVVTLIDFICYDGEIKGYKFKELSDQAKEKVIYYTLLIDSKIDTKFPNYKATLEQKYQDAKGYLFSKYMELTASICAKYPDACAEATKDLNDLKGALNITWDFIKNVWTTYIKPAGASALSKLSEWYEVWKNA